MSIRNLTFARYKQRVVVVLGSTRKFNPNGWTRIRFIDTDEIISVRRVYLALMSKPIEERKPIKIRIE